MGIPKPLEIEIVSLYLNTSFPGAYGSPKQFHHSLKSVGINVDFKDLRRLLLEFVPNLTVRKDRRRKFVRRLILPPSLDYLWVTDLAFFPQAILRSNRIGGLMVTVEALSHFCFIRAIKKKTAQECANVFKELLDETERKPVRLMHDAGAEWLGNSFQSMLSHNGIVSQTTTQLPNKAALAELHIKLLKRIIYNYMRQHNVKRWIEYLPSFEHTLNTRTLKRLNGISPVEVDYFNADIFIKKLRNESNQRGSTKVKVQVDDLVRLQLPASNLTAEPRFTEELFQVITIMHKYEPAMLQVSDLTGTVVDQMYYPQQVAFVAHVK
ncbi:MAG: transposase family protein [Pseudoalteromonas sp.]|nr:transposase family protein [Pseudoalteromonas sp.]